MRFSWNVLTVGNVAGKCGDFEKWDDILKSRPSRVALARVREQDAH